MSASMPPTALLYTALNTYGNVNNLALSKSGAQIAACMNDSHVRVWRTDGQDFGTFSMDSQSNSVSSTVRDTVLTGHSGSVYAADFSPDEKYLISCSMDSTIRLWDLQLGSNIVCYKAHMFPVWDVSFSPFGYHFVSCGSDNTARLWSMDRMQPVSIQTLYISMC